MSQYEAQLDVKHDDPVPVDRHIHLDHTCTHNMDNNEPEELMRKWRKAMKSACKAQKLLQDVMEELASEMCSYQGKNGKHKMCKRHKGKDKKHIHGNHCDSTNGSCGNSLSSSTSSSSSSNSSDTEFENYSCRGRSTRHHKNHRSHHGRRNCSHSGGHECRRSHSHSLSRCYSRGHSRGHPANHNGETRHHPLPQNQSHEQHLSCDCASARTAGGSSSTCTIEDVHSL